MEADLKRRADRGRAVNIRRTCDPEQSSSSTSHRFGILQCQVAVSGCKPCAITRQPSKRCSNRAYASSLAASRVQASCRRRLCSSTSRLPPSPFTRVLTRSCDRVPISHFGANPPSSKQTTGMGCDWEQQGSLITALALSSAADRLNSSRPSAL